MSQTYHEQIDYKNTMKLRELQKELPAFADDFFRAMEIKKATNTRRNYPRTTSRRPPSASSRR